MAKSFTQSKWIALLRRGKSVYSLAELQRLTALSPASLRRSLLRAGRTHLLVRIGKGLYGNQLNPPSLEEVAGTLYPPSYISLESALFMSGVLEQAPHVLTCVTVNKTKLFRTGLGEISFSHLKKELFFGYSVEGRIFLAEPEKAALDFIYLQLQNGVEPRLDEWNLEHMKRSRIQEWSKEYPTTVPKMLLESGI
jgi:predicted transcriptional regulator of viral defense system